MDNYDILPYFSETPTVSQLQSYNIYAKVFFAGYPERAYLGKSLNYDVFTFRTSSPNTIYFFPIANDVSGGSVNCVYFGYGSGVGHWRSSFVFSYSGQTFYYWSAELSGNEHSPSIPVYTSIQAALDDYFNHPVVYSITYRLTNCAAPSAPTEAVVGDTVNVPLVFSDGYGVVNANNAYVTNNGVVIPSSYSNGVLTFTMPDPSQ